MDRLRLVLAARIATDMPDVDREVIGDVVARTLGLLAGAAAVNRAHPMTDPAVYVMAHALHDPSLHAALATARLELPGLTVDVASFTRQAARFRPVDEQEPPSGR
ncbi:conserved hypothetical protein [Frankia canadensis]|uniref:Uncharacterized protein n=1 Tax=Frankia canadensis TaxID=1836972 RepID=A0A2I2L135_9ACTN|nr:conserved hypothetical protein [Frankia canadensis]SOU58910.1 conserved hypothetical protein [Frankia canadensis]